MILMKIITLRTKKSRNQTIQTILENNQLLGAFSFAATCNNNYPVNINTFFEFCT